MSRKNGLSMLDYMETTTSGVSIPIKTIIPSYKKRLELLLAAYPYNPFYLSLLAQMKENKTLSPKQLRAIDSNFNQKIGKLLN
jgi:hypothetical protein